jgi:adenine-specific DNA-methyltransferase
VYFELKAYNQQFIEDIEAANDDELLRGIWQNMQEKGLINYKLNTQTFNEHKKDFESLSIKDKKRFLLSILDKNLLYVPFSERNNKDYAINEEDKKHTEMFYAIIN